MTALIARLLLVALMAGQFAMLGIMRADARQMICCPSVAEHVASGHATCPPAGAPANSCCIDCPFLLGVMLPAESTQRPRVHRRQIAIFPSLDVRASRRAERPPVPPPREAEYSKLGPTPFGHHPSSNS